MSNESSSSKNGSSFWGGTKNVSQPNQTSSQAMTFFVIWLVLILCLVGMSYLHDKHTDNWLRTPFLVVTVLSVCNVLYFGWIKRELPFGYRSILNHTVRGATAVAVSFLYLASVAIVAGVGWNYAKINKPTTTNSGSIVQIAEFRR